MRGVGRHEVSALLGRNDAAFSSRGGPNRVCGRDGVPAAPAGGRDSTPLPVQTLGFALLGDSLFSNARMAGPSKVSKNACPCIRPRLRRGSLAPSTLRGYAAKGHPWPIAALSASMPLAPLRIDSARPPEGPRSAAPAYLGTRAFGVGTGFLLFSRSCYQASKGIASKATLIPARRIKS